MKKSTKIVRIVLQVLVSLAFLAAGFAKVTANAGEVALFSSVHLESTLMAIGALEILVAIGLWFRNTRTVAVLFGTAILGAAFAETISVGMASAVIAPGLVLLFTWALFVVDHCHSTNQMEK
jgi:hypothetical protein